MQVLNSARELKDYLTTTLEKDLTRLQLGLEDTSKDHAATQLQRGQLLQCRKTLNDLKSLKL